jgi:hypothetical protein
MEAGWRALRGLPRAELHRLSDKQIRAHLSAVEMSSARGASES